MMGKQMPAAISIMYDRLTGSAKFGVTPGGGAPPGINQNAVRLKSAIFFLF